MLGSHGQSIHIIFGFDELSDDTLLNLQLYLLIHVELEQIREKNKQLRMASLARVVLQRRCELVDGVDINHHKYRLVRAHYQALQETLEDWCHDCTVMHHETELARGAYRCEHVVRVASVQGHHHERLSQDAQVS